MSDRYVSYTISDSIAVLTFDNPPLNAFTAPVKEQFYAALKELESRIKEIHVLVITGAGKAFIAGADIKSFPEMTPEKARDRLKVSKEMFLKLERFERPTICAINGFCFGAGVEMAMCCDLRVASVKAQLGQLEVNLGIIPGAGGTQRLPRLVGPGVAKQMIYTGSILTANEALEIGLINKVVEHEQLMDEVMKMSTLIAKKSPLALRAAKESIDRGLNVPLEEGLEIEAWLWSSLCGTKDQKEGALAFLEKREPKFTGE
jgi:enoyl-CoA hydratase